MTVSFLGRSFYSLVKYFSCFQTIRTPQCWKHCETNPFFLPPFRQDVEKEGLMNRFSDFASSFFRRGDGTVIIFGFRHPWETDFVHQGSLSSAFAFLNWWTAQSIPIPCGILMVRRGHHTRMVLLYSGKGWGGVENVFKIFQGNSELFSA